MMNDVSVNFFLIYVTLTFLFFMTLTLKEILIVTLNWMIFFVLRNLDLLFALCDLDFEGDLDCDLELDDAWRLCLSPLIYYILFYLSLCAFYEKTKNVNLMILMMILKLTLILTLNVCMIFYVTFSSQFLVRFSRVALDWPWPWSWPWRTSWLFLRWLLHNFWVRFSLAFLLIQGHLYVLSGD